MATQLELQTIGELQLRNLNPSHVAEMDGSIAQPQFDTSVSSLPPSMTRTRSAILMATLAGISFLNTFNSGMLTVALPSIAADLSIPNALLLWPASVYALTLGCSLLLIGAIADVVGNRPILVTGTALFTVFTLACSLAQTTGELIAFRALQGVAMAFCMPTAVGIITSTFQSGKARNVAFATFGGGSPIGFATGLVLGGIFVQTVGWRTGYYLACGANALVFLMAFVTIPKVEARGDVWHRLKNDLDWVGVALASTCLAISSYVFA